VSNGWTSRPTEEKWKITSVVEIDSQQITYFRLFISYYLFGLPPERPTYFVLLIFLTDPWTVKSWVSPLFPQAIHYKISDWE